MEDEALRLKYRSLMNQLNQINQDLIFFEKDFVMLKESISQYIRIDNQPLGEEIYQEVEQSIKEAISKLNQEIIPSIVEKM